MHLLALALLATLTATDASAADNSGCPQFLRPGPAYDYGNLKAGMTYHEARFLLIKNGYKPIIDKDRIKYSQYKFAFDFGYYELIDASADGFASFAWTSKNGNLQINVGVEPIPTVFACQSL